MDQETKRLKPGFWLFLTCFLLYWCSSPGILPPSAQIHWSLAKQWITPPPPALPTEPAGREHAIPLPDTGSSRKGPALSLCLTPFAAAARLLAFSDWYSPQAADLTGQFLAATLLFPALGALTVFLLYRLVVALGYHIRTAILMAIILAAGTFHWKHTLYMQEESLLVLFLTAAALLLILNEKTHSFLPAFFLSAVLGICLHIDMISLIMILPIILVAAGREIVWAKEIHPLWRISKWLLALLLGLAPFLALMGWYNFVRFGNCLETGYGLSASQMAAPSAGSSFFPALAALFFSPGKSLFLYNPILIAVPFCFFGFVRKHTVLFLALFLAVIANLVYYSMQPNWAGDPAWGARHQAALLPFLVLPLVVGLERLVLAEMVKHRSFRLEKALGRPPRSLRLFIGLLFLISIPIQISSVSYEPPPISQPAADAGLPSANPLWDYHQSQLFLRPVHFARYLVTQTKLANYTIADYTLEFLSSFGQEPGSSSGYRLHFFPFQIEASLTQNLPSPAEGENLNTEILINLLKIAWLTGLAGMLLCFIGLLHSYRRIC